MTNEPTFTERSRGAGSGRASRHPAARLEESRGSFEIHFPTPEVCVTRAVGHFSVGLARLLVDTLAPVFAEDRSVAIFHDSHDMQSYDTGARRLLTSWVLANIRTLRSIDLLVGSRIVAMGVAAANVATSLAGITLVAYTSRDAFERALADAL